MIAKNVAQAVAFRTEQTEALTCLKRDEFTPSRHKSRSSAKAVNTPTMALQHYTTQSTTIKLVNCITFNMISTQLRTEEGVKGG